MTCDNPDLRLVLFYVNELNDYDKSFLTYVLSASAFLVISQCRVCSGSSSIKQTSLQKGGTGVDGWVTYTVKCTWCMAFGIGLERSLLALVLLCLPLHKLV